VPTVLDADLGAREALPELLRLADYAVFSAPALREFSAAATDEDRIAHVLTLGPRHVGVTLGADGYLWCEAAGSGRQPGYRVDVVDTTGAGDAFHGAFSVGLAEGWPIPDIARFACAVAAMKCTRLGSRAGLPSRREVETFLAARV
jgi:sulfofructose kinase